MSSEMMDVFATQTSLGKREIADYTRRLRKEVEVLPEGLRGPRLFWIHVLPNANVQLNGLLGCDGGAEIAANDMATSALTDIDVSKPYESMARRLLESSLNGPIERRVEQAYKYAKMLNADGIVYFCHWGCLHTIGGSQYAKKYFEERGIPTLILDGDGCDRGQSGSGRTVVRVQAFIEQLERAGGERR
jgi:benzoyl-CoA reductase/2-hydroxyglutaryl-CoA dehydratase subunit BcrC/BadD/HgdB